MKKFLVLLLIVVVTPLIAGLYGILHDQFTYTISPEYFTKFKYKQFGFEPAWFGGHRQTVAVIGFLATWWTGLFIGLIHGLVGLIHKNHNAMLKNIFKAIFITLVVTILTGLIGLTLGKFYFAAAGVNWWLPEDLTDRKNFIAVGSMHNFSYLGGLIGLGVGIAFQIIWKSKKKKPMSPFSEAKK